MNWKEAFIKQAKSDYMITVGNFHKKIQKLAAMHMNIPFQENRDGFLKKIPRQVV